MLKQQNPGASAINIKISIYNYFNTIRYTAFFTKERYTLKIKVLPNFVPE